jgi:hypothetical protein
MLFVEKLYIVELYEKRKERFMYHEFLIVGRQREMYLVDEIKDAYDAFQCQTFFKMACNAITTNVFWFVK